MSWLAHILGLDNLSGPWYGFWSGFGSDITEFALLGGLYGLLRKHNCDIQGCWRFGILPVQIGDVTHHVCKRHHPGAPTASEMARSEPSGDTPTSA